MHIQILIFVYPIKLTQIWHWIHQTNDWKKKFSRSWI